MDLKVLEKKLNVEFLNKNLLIEAITHRSYLNENPSFKLDHNERLEFLGDAVLELIVSEYLFKNFKNPEGDLTSWRAALVNSASLSGVGENLYISEHLLLSKGEKADSGRARKFIIANALEAIIGALYLDRGYDYAQNFVQKNILVHLDDVIKNKLYKDAKSYFQEVIQEKKGETPYYKTLMEWGPDHAKNFKVGVFVGNNMFGEGIGESKNEAEQKAAQEALKKIEKRIV